MIRSQPMVTSVLLRVTAAIIAVVVLVTAVVVPPAPTASAGEDKIAVFGTVVGKPLDGRIEIITRRGVISLKIDDDTKIRGKKGRVKLSGVEPGMTVAGYYTEGEGGPVARNLTFVTRKQKKSFEHVVGVILERKGKKFTVRTSKGKLVVIESADGDGDNQAEPGSMIATAVERDEITGELKSTALQTARETVERLSKSIGYEISLAQRNLLKVRMSATAAVHMTRLYETLDEIQADTRLRIQAAYAEFQAGYEATLRENLVEPVTIQTTGLVLRVSDSELHVQSLSDGTRWHLRVTSATAVVLSDGGAGTIVDIVAGQIVGVSATPSSPPAWPLAKIIRVVPDDLPVADSGAAPEPTGDTITGTIILVDSGPESTGTVVVVALDDGSDSAASLTEDTVVIVDGEQLSADELEAGQEVEIVLADDGFSAQEVKASEPAPTVPHIQGNGASPAPDASPVPPPEYTLIGTLRSIGDTGVILDGVQLLLNESSATFEATSVGQRVELRFFVDAEGRLVVTGSK